MQRETDVRDAERATRCIPHTLQMQPERDMSVHDLRCW